MIDDFSREILDAQRARNALSASVQPLVSSSNTRKRSTKTSTTHHYAGGREDTTQLARAKVFREYRDRLRGLFPQLEKVLQRIFKASQESTMSSSDVQDLREVDNFLRDLKDVMESSDPDGLDRTA